MTNPRIDTRARLATLPEIFDPQDLANMCELELPVAHQYMNRWRQYGLISGLGRTGVHFNLQINPMAREELLKPALIKAMKRNVLQVGALPLVKAGWFSHTGEDPVEFIVRSETHQQTLPSLDEENIILLRRPDWWFDAVNARNDTAMIAADMIMSHLIAKTPPSRFDVGPDYNWSRLSNDLDADLIRFRQNTVERRISEIIEAAPIRLARAMASLNIKECVNSCLRKQAEDAVPKLHA